MFKSLGNEKKGNDGFLRHFSKILSLFNTFYENKGFKKSFNLCNYRMNIEYIHGFYDREILSSI